MLRETEQMSKPSVEGFAAFCAVSIIAFCRCNNEKLKCQYLLFLGSDTQYIFLPLIVRNKMISPSQAFPQRIDL